MKFQSGKNSVVFVFVVVLAFMSFSCQKAQTSGNQSAANQETIKASSPTEAYKMLYAAVKAKDTGKIRQMLSKSTIAFVGGAAKQFNHTMEKQLENGLLETTFADTLPPIRDERVKDNFGAIEVFNQKTKSWDETAFVNEDGGWKLAVGEQFADTYKSPGKGQAQLEAEASNSMNGNKSISEPNKNGHFPMNNSKLPAAGNGKVKTAEVPRESANKTTAGKEQQ